MTTQAVTEKLNEVKEELAEFRDSATKLVRRNPWTAVSTAAAVGVVLGLLLRWRT
jgi:ElaB/YqjD/DUF883 family membrane-anchored ribosome-binding protein